MVKEIKDADFDSEVLNSNKIVLVDFWAPWCGPCKTLGPILEETSQEIGSEASIVKVNIDKNLDSATKYSVRAVPTMMIFKNGKRLDTKVGILEKEKLIEWIRSNKDA